MKDYESIGCVEDWTNIILTPLGHYALELGGDQNHDIIISVEYDEINDYIIRGILLNYHHLLHIL